VTSDKIQGMTLGSLVGTTLSESNRVIFAIVLIGALISIGAIGWVTNLQRRQAEEQQAAIQKAEEI
jgi:hypothetical protein